MKIKSRLIFKPCLTLIALSGISLGTAFSQNKPFFSADYPTGQPVVVSTAAAAQESPVPQATPVPNLSQWGVDYDKAHPLLSDASLKASLQQASAAAMAAPMAGYQAPPPGWQPKTAEEWMTNMVMQYRLFDQSVKEDQARAKALTDANAALNAEVRAWDKAHPEAP